MIGKLSLNSICETFSEKQLPFQPYSTGTLENCNSNTSGACLQNLEVECACLDRARMKKREKIQGFMEIHLVLLLRKRNSVAD